MRVDRTPLFVLVVLAVVAAGQFATHYPELPQTMAVHFGADGRANGWSDKGAFTVAYAAVEAVILLAAVALALFGDRIPTNALNIPNADYWLAPERRRETLRFTWTRVVWLETATMAFLIAVAEVVFRANRAEGPPALTSNFFVVLAAFVVAIVWQSVSMMLRFRVPTGQEPTAPRRP